MLVGLASWTVAAKCPCLTSILRVKNKKVDAESANVRLAVNKVILAQANQVRALGKSVGSKLSRRERRNFKS